MSKANPKHAFKVTPTQVATLFDKVRAKDNDRARAVFITHAVAGYWCIEIETLPAEWFTLEFRVSVIDPATLRLDPKRCHTFRDYTLVEAYIRKLRVDKDQEPPTLGNLKLVRLEPRK